MTDEIQPKRHRPLITHNHRKRSLLTWLVPLAIIIAIMVFLPKLVVLIGS